MCPEHWGESPPLHPPVLVGKLLNQELREWLIMLLPRIELRGRYTQEATNIMTPVAKSNIGSSQSEEDLEVKGGPALYSNA